MATTRALGRVGGSTAHGWICGAPGSCGRHPQVNKILAGKGLMDAEVAAKRPYRILGFCNPPEAFKVLQAEPSVGLFLPCNAAVAVAEDGRVEVALPDPYAYLGIVSNKAGILGSVERVRAALKTALAEM